MRYFNSVTNPSLVGIVYHIELGNAAFL